MYPFGKDVKKDIRKVHYSFVSVENKEDRKALFDYLLLNGYSLMDMKMYDDDTFQVVGIPLNKKVDNVVGYVGVMVMACQTYHGAKKYTLKEFIEGER